MNEIVSEKPVRVMLGRNDTVVSILMFLPRQIMHTIIECYMPTGRHSDN